MTLARPVLWPEWIARSRVEVGLEWVRAAVPPIARAWYLAGPEVHAGDDSVLVLWGQEAYSVVVAESPLDFGLRG